MFYNAQLKKIKRKKLDNVGNALKDKIEEVIITADMGGISTKQNQDSIK